MLVVLVAVDTGALFASNMNSGTLGGGQSVPTAHGLPFRNSTMMVYKNQPASGEFAAVAH